MSFEENSNRQIEEAGRNHDVLELNTDVSGRKKNKKNKKRKRLDEDIMQNPPEAHDAASQQGRIKKPKRKKHKGSHNENHGQEKESAPILRSLRDDGIRDHNHDDHLASSQLQRENFEGYLNNTYGSEGRSKNANRKKKKEEKISSHKQSDLGVNGSVVLDSIIEEDREAIRDLLSPTRKASDPPTRSVERADLHPSTIDEFDSNDELVLSFLQEYASQASPPKFSILHDTQAGGPSYDSGANNQEDETQGTEDSTKLYSELFLPSSPSRVDLLKKHKSKKRKGHEHSVLGTRDKTPNGNRNAAVDPILVPTLSPERQSVMHTESGSTAKSDETTTHQEARPGKLKRVPLMKRKERALVEVGNARENAKSHAPVNRYSPEVQHEEQDQVLSGIEDVQAHSTQFQENSDMPQRSTKDKTSKSHSRKQSRSTYRPDNYNPPISELAKKGGMFTKAESEQIYSFRDSYCAEHSMTHAQFATERVQANAHNNAKLSEFWSEVEAVLSYRNRQAIQKFCRRQFHVFAKRGTWTEEEDQQLRDAVELKGKSWIVVGEICERLPEDCRDRYRNHTYKADVRNNYAWTDAESRDLCRAVGECIYLLREDRRYRKQLGIESDVDADSQDERFIDDKLINWAVVSERMEGSRSRIQCSYKWKAMKQADRTRYWRELRDARRKMAQLTKTGKLPEAQPSWRTKRAQYKVAANLLPGDKFDILQSLLRHGARNEKEISWVRVGKGEEWRQRWQTIDLKMAWEHIKGSSEHLEGDLPGQIRQLLSKLTSDEGDRLNERYQPKEKELNSAKKKRAKELRQGVPEGEPRKKKPKSKEIVEDDDSASESEDDANENEIRGADDEDSSYPHHPVTNMDDGNIDPTLTTTAATATRRSRSRSLDSLGLFSE